MNAQRHGLRSQEWRILKQALRDQCGTLEEINEWLE
jgi:hypothetical protein